MEGIIGNLSCFDALRSNNFYDDNDQLEVEDIPQIKMPLSSLGYLGALKARRPQIIFLTEE